MRTEGVIGRAVETRVAADHLVDQPEGFSQLLSGQRGHSACIPDAFIAPLVAKLKASNCQLKHPWCYPTVTSPRYSRCDVRC
jgi:hypothetical protein